MEEWDNQIDRLDEYMRHLHYRLSVETNPSVLIEPTDYVVKHLEILTSNMNAYNSIDMCDLKERTRCLLLFACKFITKLSNVIAGIRSSWRWGKSRKSWK